MRCGPTSAYEPVDAAAAFRAIWSSEGQGRQARRSPPLRAPSGAAGRSTDDRDGSELSAAAKIALVDASRIGSRVAAVLMANIAGSALGAILTGWLALTYVGSAGSIRWWRSAGCSSPSPRPEAAASGDGTRPRGAGASSSRRSPWSGCPTAGALGAAARHRAASHRPGRRCTACRCSKASGARGTVFVNGIGQSWIPHAAASTPRSARCRRSCTPARDRGGDRPGLGRHRLCARRTAGTDANHLPRDHRTAARDAAGLGAAHAQSRP